MLETVNKVLHFFFPKANLQGHTEMALWQTILLSSLFLILSASLFVAFSYMWEGSTIEYGYPKRKIKYIKKIKNSGSLISRFFLIRITVNADRFGFFLILNLICQYFNIFSMICTLVGFVASIITHTDNWAMLLTCGSVLSINLVLVLLMTIPDLICLPSIRRLYTFRKK